MKIILNKLFTYYLVKKTLDIFRSVFEGLQLEHQLQRRYWSSARCVLSYYMSTVYYVYGRVKGSLGSSNLWKDHKFKIPFFLLIKILQLLWHKTNKNSFLDVSFSIIHKIMAKRTILPLNYSRIPQVQIIHNHDNWAVKITRPSKMTELTWLWHSNLNFVTSLTNLRVEWNCGCS